MRLPQVVALVVLVPAAAGALDPRVQVKDLPLGGDRFSTVATVEGTALPVTITLETGDGYENCAPSVPFPLRRVVTRAGDTRLLESGPAKASQRWRCSYRFRSALGDLGRTSPDDCSLTLPFSPTGTSRVIQGFDGALTHGGRLRHALDFAMPEGTAVLAAREGVVTWVMDDAQDGTRPGGNTVSLLHADGTLTQYAHLRRGSVRVREGQSVARGAVVASSGSTNDTPVAPHLHFEVFLNPGTDRWTLPFTLSLPGGACRTPSEGESL